MPKQRYEISDVDWELVADLFNTPHRTRRPRADDRVMLNGVFGSHATQQRHLRQVRIIQAEISERW